MKVLTVLGPVVWEKGDFVFQSKCSLSDWSQLQAVLLPWIMPESFNPLKERSLISLQKMRRFPLHSLVSSSLPGVKVSGLICGATVPQCPAPFLPIPLK